MLRGRRPLAQDLRHAIIQAASDVAEGHFVSHEKRDRELGMHCPISRRDFLNGVAVGISGMLASDALVAPVTADDFAPEKAPGYYPPALLGMRGNHEGTYTYAHG